jgi:hypothetical protein
VLHTATLAAARLEMKAKRRELLGAMRAMPDYTMKLSWRLGSAVPGLGMLLRRYAPADTYTLWKVGGGLRVGVLWGWGAGDAGQPNPCALGMAAAGPLARRPLRAPASRFAPSPHPPPFPAPLHTPPPLPLCPPRQVGDRLRVDGTLMGIDNKSLSLIPEWKRGHFSLIMDGSACSSGGALPPAAAAAAANGGASGGAPHANGGAAAEAGGDSSRGGTPTVCGDSSGGGAAARPSEGGSAPRLLFLHHGKQRWVDLGADKKSMKAEETAALEEELLLALERCACRARGAGGFGRGVGRWALGGTKEERGLAAARQRAAPAVPTRPRCALPLPIPSPTPRSDVDKQRFKARGFTFAPIRGWLGGEVKERIEGWPCRVYEAAGKLVGVSTSKAAWPLEETATFEDYLALDAPDDDVAEVAFDPLNPTTYEPVTRSPQRGARGGGGVAGGGGSPRGVSDEEDEVALAEELAADWTEELGTGSDDGDRGAGASGASWWGSGAGSSGGHTRGGSKRGGGGGSWWSGGKADAAAEEDDGDDAGRAADRSSPSRRGRRDAGSPSGRGKKAKKKGGGSGSGSGGSGRTLRARLWMAQGFPMRLSELVPLLAVIGSANKQISKVAKFMARYAGLDLFPVRIQVPLLLTVYAVVGFSRFEPLSEADAPGPEFFEVRGLRCWVRARGRLGWAASGLASTTLPHPHATPPPLTPLPSPPPPPPPPTLAGPRGLLPPAAQ